MDEIVMGGMVLETNMAEILKHVDAANALEKKEVRRCDDPLDVLLIFVYHTS